MRRWIRRATSGIRGRVGRLLHPGWYSWNDVEVAFIVSTGRTGTQKLAHVMSALCRGVDARHEPSPDMFDLGTDYVRGRIALERALVHFRISRDYVCREIHRVGCDYYIESNNNVSLIIPVIRRFFGRCRIIHVVRDGRDFVRSAYSKVVPSVSRPGAEVLLLSDADPRKRLQAPDFEHDPYRDRWSQMSRFERLCWLWMKLDSMICQEIADDPLAMTVKFEDIFDEASDYKGLWSILDFLGLASRMTVPAERVAQLMSEKTNRTARYLISPWQQWPDEMMFQFSQIAGEHMAHHGYSC